MTVAEIHERTQQIKDVADDPEIAHPLEDGLRRDVLEAIANGAANPRELAAAVLATSDIEFPRWYA